MSWLFGRPKRLFSYRKTTYVTSVATPFTPNRCSGMAIWQKNTYFALGDGANRLLIQTASMDIIQADTIEQYNRYFGFETQHPLVSVAHFDQSENQPSHRMTFGFYAIFLKKTTGCTISYGRTSYDFDDQTVVCFAPGQTVGIHRTADGIVPEADGILFHPDFLNRTPLAQKMKQYSYFSYSANEALHLSSEERIVLRDYMEKITQELRHPIDKFSKPLIISNIEVLLNYCMRFYERQFVTRSDMHHDALIRFEQLLDEYLDTRLAVKHGVPSVKYFADKICLSPNYFGDLVKAETGKTAQELIQRKMVLYAKEAMLDSGRSVKQVAEQLGFHYPQHFMRFFKKQVGCTPKEYKQAIVAES